MSSPAWLQSAINTGNTQRKAPFVPFVPLCSLEDFEAKSEPPYRQTPARIGLQDFVPSVPCVPLKKQHGRTNSGKTVIEASQTHINEGGRENIPEPETPTPANMSDLQADYWHYLQPKQREAVARYRASDDSLHELLRMVVFAKQADEPRNIRTTVHGVVLLWQGYQWQDQSELMSYWHGRALQAWRLAHE